jgi:hypothetical protein
VTDGVMHDGDKGNIQPADTRHQDGRPQVRAKIDHRVGPIDRDPFQDPALSTEIISQHGGWGTPPDGVDGNELRPQERKVLKQLATAGYDECLVKVFSSGARQRELQRQAGDCAATSEREKKQLVPDGAALRA